MAHILKNAQAINEDVALVHGVDAACGPAASYEAAGIVNNFRLTTAGLQSLVAAGERAGTLDTGGQSFSNGPDWDLQQFGISSNVSGVGSSNALQSILDNALAANKPIVLGLDNANQLSSEPPNLHGHFVTIVGQNSDGSYVTADPNSPQSSSGGFTSNTLGQLFAAQPVTATVPTKAGLGSSSLANVGSTGGVGLGGLTVDINFPDLSQLISSGISQGIQDIGSAFGGWMHMLTRGAVLVLGLGIIGISGYQLLNSVPAIPEQRPGLLKQVGGSLQEKGQQITGFIAANSKDAAALVA